MNRREFLNIIGVIALIALIQSPTKLRGRALMDSPLIYTPIPITTSSTYPKEKYTTVAEDFKTPESLGNHYGLNVEQDIIEGLKEKMISLMGVPKDLIL